MAILLLYSTTDGHTKTIADHVVGKLQAANSQLEIEVYELDEFLQWPMDLDIYDTIILGASIRYGHHKKSVTTFIKRYEAFLQKNLFAFFSVNLTARKPEKNLPENNPYMLKFYDRLPLKPNVDAVFAGRLAYPEYKWYDKIMIRLIMKITKGPTNPDTVQVFTDWQAVDSFVEQVCQARNTSCLSSERGG